MVFTACSELRKVLFLAPSVFCLCTKYLGNRQTDLRQIHTEDVCYHMLGGVGRSRSKVKGQCHKGQTTAIFGSFAGLHAVYVW